MAVSNGFDVTIMFSDVVMLRYTMLRRKTTKIAWKASFSVKLVNICIWSVFVCHALSQCFLTVGFVTYLSSFYCYTFVFGDWCNLHLVLLWTSRSTTTENRLFFCWLHFGKQNKNEWWI